MWAEVVKIYFLEDPVSYSKKKKYSPLALAIFPRTTSRTFGSDLTRSLIYSVVLIKSIKWLWSFIKYPCMEKVAIILSNHGPGKNLAPYNVWKKSRKTHKYYSKDNNTKT